MSGALLRIEHLEVRYGDLIGVSDVSLEVPEGSVVALLGSNGGGKTTTLNAIAGLIPVHSGSIRFRGEDIVRLGIAHVPEGRGTFVRLTVEENLALGASGRRSRSGLGADMERVYGYFPILKERRRQQAGTLSGGEQQMLAVGRALMLQPRLMLLDEPSFGLAPLVVREVFDILAAINRDEKVSMLLVEQNASLALGLADEAYLLETGRIVMSGASQAIRENESVRRSYLGY